MKVSFTIAQKADGSYVVLYAGADIQKAVDAHDQACENLDQEGSSKDGYISVAAFRKPMPFKRRRFESKEANARWAAAAEAKAKQDAEDHKNAKLAAKARAIAEAKAKGAAHAKAQADALARQKDDAIERAKEIRRQTAELEANAAARAAARSRELGLDAPKAPNAPERPVTKKAKAKEEAEAPVETGENLDAAPSGEETE